MKFPRSGLRGLALREASPDLMRTVNLVRAALDAKINSPAPGPGAEVGRKWFELDAVYDDHAVICLDGRHWSYAYTLVDGVATLAEPLEVIETFVPLKESAPLEGDLRLVEAEGQAEGAVWEATLIQAGVSLNDVFYSDALLREALPLFDGARICLKSDEKHIKGDGRDLSNVVGWADAPRFIEGAGPDSGRVVATLNLPGLPENTRALLVGAFKAGKQDIAGLSIDATGKGSVRMLEGKRVRVPKKIDRVDSVDLIVEPGAGGRLIRLVEAAPEPIVNTGDPDMKLRELMLRLIEAKKPEAYAKIDPETVTDEALEALYREAVAADKAPAINLSQQVADAEERLRMVEARSTARAKIDASNLPTPAKDRLQRDFAARDRFVEADVEAAIKDEREYLARFVESGRVRVPAFEVEVEDRSARVADMLDAFFDPQHKDHRQVQSFREAYIEVTGDKRVTGRLQDCDRARLAESLGVYREALDSTSWADALGNSITRRMQAEYVSNVDLQAWRKVATVGRVNDFRTQERFRIGGYGNLPIVAESGNYEPLGSPGDDKASFAAQKRGGTESITREMILADDVGAIRRVPVEMALSAGNTLYEFAFDFFRTNAAIYDTKALYHADHGNLFTSALDATAFAAHRLAMVKQTRAGSGKRMGVSPATVLVPYELQEAAFNLFVRNQNLDKTFVQAINPEVITVNHWTDGNDWVTVADPRRHAVLEISFVNGQEEPELFIQDMPNVGSLFSNDKITYKLRHEYGGLILVDGEKGTTKSVVA